MDAKKVPFYGFEELQDLRADYAERGATAEQWVDLARQFEASGALSNSAACYGRARQAKQPTATIKRLGRRWFLFFEGRAERSGTKRELIKYALTAGWQVSYAC